MNYTTSTMEREMNGQQGFTDIPVEDELISGPGDEVESTSPAAAHKQEKSKALDNKKNGSSMQAVQMEYPTKSHPVHVPALIEFSISISWAILVTSGVLIGLISYKSGVKGLEFFLRTGSAVFLSGMILITFNWILAHGSYEIHKEKVEKEKQERENEALFDDEFDMNDYEDEDEFINSEAGIENDQVESES